jgi:hypothetical protein
MSAGRLDDDFDGPTPVADKKPTRDDVLGALKWSEPREVSTKLGPRLVSSADANEMVFALWREEKDALKSAGYSLGEFRGKWQISKWEKLPDKIVVSRENAKALSRATDADINVPAPDGYAYLGYQRAGIAFGFERPAVLIGDEMGLGKTIQAIGILNACPELKRVLVICPASLKLNWKRELERWCVRKRPILVADSKLFAALADGVTIVNYDVLHKHEETLRTTDWDALICDEAHFLKNPGARRTQMVFGSKATKKEKASGMVDVPGLAAKKRILLSGTPIANKPVELFPLISYLDPVTWGNEWKFKQRYCNPPEAPIWMSDFSFRPLGEIKVGDEIIGWRKAEPGSRAKKGNGMDTLCKSTVVAVNRRIAPIVKVMLESGKIIRCTPDHLWLNSLCNEERAKWVSVQIDRTLVRVVDVEPELSGDKLRDAAWLAGVYDGEGTWPQIAQCPIANPLVYQKIQDALTNLGFAFTKYPDRISITGGRAAAIRFRRFVQPNKLGHLESSILTTRFKSPERVVGIWPDGEGEVISMTTTTGNYVAWGLASKNCGAHHNGFGWEFNGASHLDELQDKLRSTIMVRRLKKDVLTELPPKRRQVIEFPATPAMAHLVKQEMEVYEGVDELEAEVELAAASDDPNAYEDAVKKLRKGQQARFEGLSELRRATAEAKIPLCVEHLEEAVEESGKVVVFAHHKTVVRAIAEKFGDAAVSLVGDTPMQERQDAVDRFQKDPECKLFIGSIMAAGVGITLTAAAHVVFCELDWVPGNVSQAEDRCHRIGQKDSVLVQHLVLEGSLDATIARRIISKQDVIDKALDVVAAKKSAEPEVAKSPERANLEALANRMTDAQREAAAEAIVRLKAMCDGASSWDGSGFSKIDVRIGHSLAAQAMDPRGLSRKQAALAQKVAFKYRGQLPDELVERLRFAQENNDQEKQEKP